MFIFWEVPPRLKGIDHELVSQPAQNLFSGLMIALPIFLSGAPDAMFALAAASSDGLGPDEFRRQAQAADRKVSTARWSGPVISQPALYVAERIFFDAEFHR
jgi:hypothetical protein